MIISTDDPDTLIGTNGQNTINGLGEGDRIHGWEQMIESWEVLEMME